jgi:hypothetical protein
MMHQELRHRRPLRTLKVPWTQKLKRSITAPAQLSRCRMKVPALAAPEDRLLFLSNQRRAMEDPKSAVPRLPASSTMNILAPPVRPDLFATYLPPLHRPPRPTTAERVPLLELAQMRDGVVRSLRSTHCTGPIHGGSVEFQHRGAEHVHLDPSFFTLSSGSPS